MYKVNQESLSRRYTIQTTERDALERKVDRLEKDALHCESVVMERFKFLEGQVELGERCRRA